MNCLPGVHCVSQINRFSQSLKESFKHSGRGGKVYPPSGKAYGSILCEPGGVLLFTSKSGLLLYWFIAFIAIFAIFLSMQIVAALQYKI